MFITAPPAPMPMRMPMPLSLGLPFSTVSCSRCGAWRCTMSLFMMKPPAHSTTPRVARMLRSSPSMRATTPTTAPASSTIAVSARASQRMRTPLAVAEAISFSISILPPSSPWALPLWPRGAAAARARKSLQVSLPL